jgi:hypothetical protein
MNSLFDVNSNILSGCLNRPISENENLYKCVNSSKRISKHRLVDGVFDCFEKDDEYFNNSCLLNDKYRFKCSSESNKCISPWNVRDTIANCFGSEDEMYILTTINNAEITFPILCNGFFDIINVDNKLEEETDESHCEYWPCINQYTRCNGIWNCPNGADELNCRSSLCRSDEHACVSPLTYNITCLPYNQTGDDKIDCLGATDEYKYCRAELQLSRLETYKCWNSSTCISVHYLCDGTADCLFKDDERLCSNFNFNLYICHSVWNNHRTLAQDYLCERLDIKSPIVYFQIENSIHKIDSSTKPRSSIEYNAHQSWYCNRGILMYRDQSEEEICLCPPSYYGSRCQYQNERVSLTVQIRTGQTRIVYELIFILIDNIGQIHSIEQRSFFIYT